MTIFSELSRRNVIRVGIAYAIASWVLLQIVDVVVPILELPEWAPKLIFVILAIGLVPALLFAWAFELTPDGIKKESEIDRSQSVVSETGRKLNFIIIATLVVAVALLLVEREAGQSDPTETVAVEDLSIAEEEEKSIAVLPFVNMSSDSEQEYFSDGITEEILNSLASVTELKVAGRTSSFAFKGQNDDLRRIGEALGVSHILEGSVRKAGAEVRITAQLIQVDNGFHLWSETYDRELTDVFAIQDEIANEILKQLRSKLLDEDVAVVSAKRTDPEVYALYLRAKQRIYSRMGSEIETAVRELDQAIQLDSEYAPAFAQRSIATMLLSDAQYGTIPNDESNRRGKRFADQSLRLDPDLAEGYAALGLYYTRDSVETDVAIDVLVKALSINPNLIDASNWLQIALTDAGDMSGALEIIEAMTERDPLYPPAFSNAMMMFNNFGLQDKATALLKRMEAFDPDNPNLLLARATNFTYSGRAGESLQTMELRRELGDMSGVGEIFLSIGLLNTGQFERATEEGSKFWRASALYALGRKEEALELAYEYAATGFPEDLFQFLIQEGREQDLIDYLEERWPSIVTFADENSGDAFGFSIMSDVALAYRRVGNQDRYEEAMMLADRRISSLAEQGIENFVFSGNRAVHLALSDDKEAAFEQLESAVEAGWVRFGPLEEAVPALVVLVDDPRFARIEAAILENINVNRAVVGLQPLNADFSVTVD